MSHQQHSLFRNKITNKLPSTVNRKIEILRKKPLRKRAKSIAEKGNAYVDRVLAIVIKPDSGFDPYPVADSTVFDVTNAFCNALCCNLALSGGLLTGLQYLHRFRPCCLREKDGRIHVNADIGTGPICFTSQGMLGFMCMKPTFNFKANIMYAQMLVHFSVDASTGKDLQLHKLQLYSMRHLSARVEGLWPFTFAINAAIARYVTYYEERIRNRLSRVVQNHLTEVLSQYQFPSKKVLYGATPLSRPPAANLPLYMGNLFAIVEESDSE